MRHPRLRGHGVLPARVLRLLLHILRVRHLLLLLGRHVLRGHAAAARHVGGLGGDLGVGDVFGGVDGGFAVDAVFVAGAGFGRIEAGLGRGQMVFKKGRGRGEDTWMRFLPSALVTRGWSLGVVKV